ncbi:hypothetical protein GHT06_001554 [Daphnia sinensis]|uniref:Uncharacterized protein n=1 Tax=Daphnia sinensis TaxID=1820382 RepID=A0AAD5KWK2_9CRUS|nr:hypothetical protein GHT06_004541 [Daphnia sinensis]KAI9551288.1 hypothetical protein GHT06_001554 [Daphnia sinensis]
MAGPMMLFFISSVFWTAGTSNPVLPTQSVAVHNTYIQSFRHFLKDLKNMAGGFMANRIDKLQHKHHLAKEKVTRIFQKLFTSFRKTKQTN